MDTWSTCLTLTVARARRFCFCTRSWERRTNGSWGTNITICVSSPRDGPSRRADKSISSCAASILANDGYDVWLGDFRGNLYSKQHTRLNTSDPEYWKFRWVAAAGKYYGVVRVDLSESPPHRHSATIIDLLTRIVIFVFDRGPQFDRRVNRTSVRSRCLS